MIFYNFEGKWPRSLRLRPIKKQLSRSVFVFFSKSAENFAPAAHQKAIITKRFFFFCEKGGEFRACSPSKGNYHEVFLFFFETRLLIDLAFPERTRTVAPAKLTRRGGTTCKSRDCANFVFLGGDTQIVGAKKVFGAKHKIGATKCFGANKKCWRPAAAAVAVA